MRTSLILVFLAFSASVQALDLGTLFHTPQERQRLDRLRNPEPVEKPSEPVIPDPAVTGYVKRSDGKSTVFLDKRPYPARDGKLQGLLEPRVIERYEPAPPLPSPSPSPAADAEEAGAAAKPAPSKGAPAARPKNAKGD